MGDILSQQVKGKLHPCAFFSRCLTQAEQNYDMGDRELLAIKLALLERQHWLAGSDHLVLIWTDHKNLAYLQAAKRLNARQAGGHYFHKIQPPYYLQAQITEHKAGRAVPPVRATSGGVGEGENHFAFHTQMGRFTGPFEIHVWCFV